MTLYTITAQTHISQGDENNMEQLEQPMQSETIGELAKAVSAMQKTELFAITDSTNPFFKSQYSDLSSVWRAVRAPMTANGLAITQTTEPYPDGVIVVTTLMHKSGEWIKGKLAGTIVPDKKGIRTPQGLLSLITYLRRAGVSAIVGVCPEDDDGESVSGRDNDAVPEKKTKKNTPATKPPVVPNMDTSGIHEYPKDKPMIPVKFDMPLEEYPISTFQINIKQFDKEGTHWDVQGADVWTRDGMFYSTASGFGSPMKCVHVALVDAVLRFGFDAVKIAYPNVDMIGGE